MTPLQAGVLELIENVALLIFIAWCLWFAFKD